MGDKLKGLLIFAIGAAVGSAATYAYVKGKYEKIADEEIASMRDYYFRKNDISEPVKTEDPVVEEEPEEEITIRDYTKVNTNLGYSRDSEIDDVEKPYVISPEEFGEVAGYEEISLLYFADGFITDEMDVLVDDVDDIIGWENLNHFGEYEDDALHIRNDARQCDYEILKDLRMYRDIKKE